MNCPYCKVPLMKSMTSCPKCKYELNAPNGGEKHQRWLAGQGIATEYNKEYIEELYEENREKIEAKIAERKALEARIEAEQIRQNEASKIMISSGFNFDGYKIVKYSGYISGDDAVQIPRSGVFGSDNGAKLTNALVRIRRQALKELKLAAYDLGCNAVIGVDFDYITLEPETANIGGGTLYEPYIICVTANGNAVIIEKDD